MPDVKIDQIGQMFERFGPRIQEAAIRGAYAAALRGVQDIQARIIPSRSPIPFDRGVYKAGWRATPEADGADISNPEQQALFIEEGVRGQNVKIGRAMILALAAWAQRKGIVGKGDNPTAIAWAIAKNMKRRGVFNGGKGFGVLKELVNNYLSGFVEEEIGAEIEALEL